MSYLNELLLLDGLDSRFVDDSAGNSAMTYGASATYGSWIQLIAAGVTTEDMVITQIVFVTGIGTSNTTINRMVQFGYGTVASPLTLNIEIPLNSRTHAAAISQTGLMVLPAPLYLPRGKGLIARGKRDIAVNETARQPLVTGMTLTAWNLLAEMCGRMGYEGTLGLLGPDYDMSEISNPAVGAMPTALTVTSGAATDDWGAWTQVIANAPNDGWITHVNMAKVVINSVEGVADIELAVGAAGKEHVIGRTRTYEPGQQGNFTSGPPLLFPLLRRAFVPMGERLSARSRVNNAASDLFLLVPVLKKHTGVT